jgi:hypothetical protein
MKLTLNRTLILLSISIVVLSCLALTINHFIYRYPGNNYFPPQVFGLAMILLGIVWGLRIYFGRESRWALAGEELLNLFLVMSLIALASNAVQLTPFPPIDSYIVRFEAIFHLHMDRIIHWTSQYPHFKNLLILSYASLPQQMSLLPLFLIFMGRFQLLKEYYFLLLFTCLIGFSFYYFFPTIAPASVVASPLFFDSQIATGLKFYQIHHHIKPTTLEGGLIALPSFHCIWALLCVYLAREWRWLHLLILTLNLLLIASCVLLGWHYLIDVIAAIALLALGFYCLKHLIARQITS